MATSGTYTSGRYGDSYGPWLQLYWTRIDVDEANNRSKLRLTLSLHSDRSLYFSSSKTGSLEGSSFTHTSGFSGTGSKTLRTRDIWVNHFSDGSGSIVLNGSFDLDINWSGNWIGTMSVSGTAYLDAIPRASDFTAFTLSNPTLNYNTSTTINYTLGRKSSAFSHQMTLKYGSKTIASWTDSSTGSRTRTLSAAEVNSILYSMPSSVSGSLRLYMQTKSGSTNIGDEKYIIEGVSVSTSMVPTATSLTYSIAGTGRDKTINKYVQNFSKVTASFNANNAYGANIVESRITVKRNSDGADSQTIADTSGTLGRPIALSGTYKIEAYVKDSRGRSDTTSSTFTVEAYSPPKITSMKASRGSVVTTTVAIPMTFSWSSLGTSNPANIKLIGVDNNDVSTTIMTLNAQTSGSINTTQNATAQADSKSYRYTLTVTDSFGNVAQSWAFVGTSFMEMTIKRGFGIGVGKIHERGALDVNGDIYAVGRMRIGDYSLVNEDLTNPRGLELNEGLYIRNGYLDINSFDESVYGVGRMQSYYIGGTERRWKIYGRDANYVNHTVDLDLRVGDNFGNIIQGDWNTVGNFLNGWVNYSSGSGGFPRLAYRKTTHGTVQVIGMIRNGTSSIICLLGTDYRPSSTMIFAIPTGTSTVGRLDITTDGYMRWNGPSSPSWLAINIEFPLGYS